MNPIDQEAVGGDRPSFVRRWRWPLMIGGPVVLIAAIVWFILTSGRSETTDDAYVQLAKAPVSAEIAGRVTEIDVRENQHVKAGQVLFRLDPSDEQAAQARSDAALATAQLQVTALKAAYDQQKLQLAQALTTQAFATREAARQQALVAAGVSSAQQAADARHTADVAISQVAIARQQLATALANLGAGASDPNRFPGVLQARASRQTAQLDLSRTVIYARQDGVVTRVDQLQVGTHIAPAQTLFFLLSGEPWVEANFKESQLRYMRVGQPAEIEVDALGGEKLKGHVASFAPGAGTTFSALPAQNATGNWVKVAQRLPVRVAFDRPPPEVAGRAGLSAKITVDVRSGRNERPRQGG